MCINTRPIVTPSRCSVPCKQLSSIHYKLRGSSNAMCGQRSRKNTPWTWYTKDDAYIKGVKVCTRCLVRYTRMLTLKGN